MLKDRYQKEIVPTLIKEFDLKNKMSVPKVTKVVVNMGVGEASKNTDFSFPLYKLHSK